MQKKISAPPPHTQKKTLYNHAASRLVEISLVGLDTNHIHQVLSSLWCWSCLIWHSVMDLKINF